MLYRTTQPWTRRASSPGAADALVRSLALLSVVAFAVVAHIPTHVVSWLGYITRRFDLVDSARPYLPAMLQNMFWTPPVLLGGALAVRNGRAGRAAERPPITRRDVAIGALVVVAAFVPRVWPLLHDTWIKPGFDEAVYLGGAWLMRGGALPYRDFVFGHLPAGLFMLLPAARLIKAGQDGSAALLAARGTAMVSDAAATGLIYLSARQLVARPGALVAALVYAVDVVVLKVSRQVLLEPLQAPWLMAGVFFLLSALNGRRGGFAAGLWLAAGVAIKISAAVIPVAAIGILLWERRWRTLRDTIAGGVLGAAVLCGWSFVVSGDEIVRQTVLLQLGRARDMGVARGAWLLGDRSMAFTALMVALGAGALGLAAWRKRVASGWLFVCAWLGLTLALFAYNASFYPHYYPEAVPAMALLAAGVPDAWRTLRQRRSALLVGLLLLAPIGVAQARLAPQADRAPAERDEARALQALGANARVLSLLPVASVLAGRPFFHLAGGPYLLDTFLEADYLRSRLNDRWPELYTVMAAAVRAADYIIADPWTGPLPGVEQSFDVAALIPKGSTRLFTRIDRPQDVMEVGADLQLLRPAAARVETVNGQRWLVQRIRWRARTTPGPDQALALHLLDARGARVAQSDVPVNGGTTWQPGVVTTLDYRVRVPPTLPPGVYQLQAIVYSWRTGAVTPMRPATGGAAIERLGLGQIALHP